MSSFTVERQLLWEKCISPSRCRQSIAPYPGDGGKASQSVAAGYRGPIQIDNGGHQNYLLPIFRKRDASFANVRQLRYFVTAVE
jgi:hypothetical protein